MIYCLSKSCSLSILLFIWDISFGLISSPIELSCCFSSSLMASLLGLLMIMSFMFLLFMAGSVYRLVRNGLEKVPVCCYEEVRWP